MKKKKFYAYYIIRTKEKGITENWGECELKVKGTNAKYQSFKTKEEAQAWLDLGANYSKRAKREVIKITKVLEDAIYFDSGTGGRNGVEVRLTDKNGDSLLNEIVKPQKINEKGNYNLGFDVTNNYGELVGLYLALKLAMKNNVKKIFRDSHLIINYWSCGKYCLELKEETIKLIKKVTKIRSEFEKTGGEVKFISGDINPADLGYHK